MSPSPARTSRFSYALFALLLLALLDIAGLGWLESADRLGGDLLLRLHARHHPAPDNIVLLDIDQKSLENLQAEAGAWPWPRAIHGELLAAVRQQQPQAIVLDLLFNEVDRFRPDSDAFFNQQLAGPTPVYLPIARLPDGQPLPLRQLPATLGIVAGKGAANDAALPLLLPQALEPQHWRGGLINFLEDEDSIGRRYWLYQSQAGWRLYSLPAQMARDFSWALPAADNMTLHWYRRGSFQHISYGDLFQDLGREQRQRPANELRGKILIVGTSAPGLHDLRLTPMSATHSGAEILATAIANLQQDDSLQPLPRSSLLPLSLLLLLLLWQRFSQADHSISRAGLSLFLLSIAGVAGALLALRWQRQIPVFTPLLLAWLYFWLAALLAYLAERQRREQAVQLFSRFLDARVVDNLVRSGDAEQWQASQSRPVTVLFSDIRGFTSLSESAPPEQIVDLLNRYFSRQVAVIFRHGGTLDKFIGDAIMAFWGAPTDDARHAIHAVDAALDMVDELMAFRSELGQAGAHFDVGIGLHSGPAVVGLIGSSQRLDYTAIGDTVNLASRIEGQTKGVARILVSQATRELCSDQFEFTDHGLHHVKGREQGVRLFEPKRRTH